MQVPSLGWVGRGEVGMGWWSDPPSPSWPRPSISYNSISLSPVFTSHGVALGLIKTRLHSVPLGASRDTHVCFSPQSHASLLIHLRTSARSVPERSRSAYLAPEWGDWYTCWETWDSGQVGKACWAELKHSACLQGSREATWPLMTLFGNQLKMSLLESLRPSMFWSWQNPLGIHPECRGMVQPSAGCWGRMESRGVDWFSQVCDWRLDEWQRHLVMKPLRILLNDVCFSAVAFMHLTTSWCLRVNM